MPRSPTKVIASAGPARKEKKLWIEAPPSVLSSSRAPSCSVVSDERETETTATSVASIQRTRSMW